MSRLSWVQNSICPRGSPKITEGRKMVQSQSGGLQRFLGLELGALIGRPVGLHPVGAHQQKAFDAGSLCRADRPLDAPELEPLEGYPAGRVLPQDADQIHRRVAARDALLHGGRVIDCAHDRLADIRPARSLLFFGPHQEAGHMPCRHQVLDQVGADKTRCGDQARRLIRPSFPIRSTDLSFAATFSCWRNCLTA